MTECTSACAFNQVTKSFFGGGGVMRKKGDLCLISLSGINPRIHIKIKSRWRGGGDFNEIHVPYILLPTVNNGFFVHKFVHHVPCLSRSLRVTSESFATRPVRNASYIMIYTLDLACENSRPSSLPARVAFRNAKRETPLSAGSEEGRLISQATLDSAGSLDPRLDHS